MEDPGRLHDGLRRGGVEVVTMFEHYRPRFVVGVGQLALSMKRMTRSLDKATFATRALLKRVERQARRDQIDELRAQRAFHLDGGDVAEILRIEAALGIE